MTETKSKGFKAMAVLLMVAIIAFGVFGPGVSLVVAQDGNARITGPPTATQSDLTMTEPTEPPTEPSGQNTTDDTDPTDPAEPTTTDPDPETTTIGIMPIDDMILPFGLFSTTGTLKIIVKAEKVQVGNTDEYIDVNLGDLQFVDVKVTKPNDGGEFHAAINIGGEIEYTEVSDIYLYVEIPSDDEETPAYLPIEVYLPYGYSLVPDDEGNRISYTWDENDDDEICLTVTITVTQDLISFYHDCFCIPEVTTE